MVVGSICLVLWSILAAPALRRAAEASPLGARRTAALAILRPLARLSALVGLDRVDRGAEVALGRSPATPAEDLTGEPPPEGLASPGPSPFPIGPSTRPGASGSTGGTTGAGPVAAGPSQSPGPVPHPTTDRRLRVLVVGDSIGDDLAIGLGRLLSDKPDFVTKVDARQATGLARPDYFDWDEQVSLDVRSFKPDVVVAMFGANDAQSFLVGGHGVRLGSDEWREVYGRRVGRIMSDVTGKGRHILWVGLPPMKSTSFSSTMRMLNGVYREQAARHLGAQYIDAWPVLSNGNGGYAAYLPNSAGQEELLRAPDGVHLTAAGGARLAQAVFAAMRALWQASPTPSPSPSSEPTPAVSVHTPSPTNLGLQISN